ncbi:2-(trimethylamino)ethylphosphonate dioxygenase-like [Apostichopus japonicus]|uniref:2-(trimethylamino)ethylphosphonate dioxygenase-like n=1 Tax=Stichopus japonicus TaxID=307972 RepID=UPI003AB78321
MPPAQDQAVPSVDGVTIVSKTTIEIKWHDHTPSRFHTFWLRYHCHCPDCKEVHSGMRRIHPDDVPKKLTLKTTELKDGFLEVVCNEEEHSIQHPLAWLKVFSYSKEDLENRSAKRKTTFKTDSIETFEFDDIRQSEDTFYEWLQAVDKNGLALVKNVPCEDKKILELGAMVAPVYETLYGEVFNHYCSKDNITNIADLEVPLWFHQDVPYYESPPGFQLLHCMRLDSCVEGGANVFVDTFEVAEQLRREYPKYFETLQKVPATFQKIHEDNKRPCHYVYQRPHIKVNWQGKVVAVFWNPQVEGPLQVPEEMVEPYYEAYFKLAELIEKSPASITNRMEQGDCVTFNNRRMLHSRKTFKLNGGVRQLQGSYINIDDFKNALQIQYLKRNSGQLVTRVGNQCYC